MDSPVYFFLRIVTISVFITNTANAAGSCVDLFAKRKSFMDQPVLETLARPLHEAMEAGPNVWVATGHISKNANGFQRGFAELSDAVGVLSGAPLAHFSAVMRIGTQTNPKLQYLEEPQLNRSVKKYAAPFAVRGKTDEELKPPRYSGALIGEGLIPKGKIISHDITEVGLFSRTHKVDEFYVQGAISWSRKYFEFYKYVLGQGFQINPQSRGAQFYKALKKAYDQLDANYMAILEKYENGEPGPARSALIWELQKIEYSSPTWMENFRKVFEDFSNPNLKLDD